MIGKRLYLGKYKMEEYDEAVEWADNNNAIVALFDDYYEIIPMPAPSLDEAKKRKIAELKSIRDTQEVADIQVNGYLYDYDEKARERINAAIIALDLTGGTITWTLADNTDTEVSANTLRYVIAMVAQRSNELHVKYRNLKERVENATTKEQVEAIVWDE